MKRYIIWITLLVICTPSTHAGEWVKSLGSKNGVVILSAIYPDGENNVVVAGTFSSPELELDAMTTLQNKGTTDVFLVKYNQEGEILWSHSFGGLKDDYVNDICTDSENSIYITGNFLSTTLEIGGTTITSSWPYNVYVAKFDKSGSLKWLRHSRNLTSWSYGTSIHADVDDNVYFTGYTNGKEILFGDLDIYLNTGNRKGFYGKLDPEGNFLLARFLGDESEDQYDIRDITTDADGNMYLAGRKTIHMEPDPVTYLEYRDLMYFCKTDPYGNITWSYEDTAFHWTEYIHHHNDSLFVVGNREEFRAIFNGGTIDTTSKFCYAVFETTSGLIWKKDVIGALAYDAFINDTSFMVIGGVLKDIVELNDYRIYRNSDSSSICPIYQDVFLFEADKSGTVEFATSVPGGLEDLASGICLSGNGDLVYSGTFESYSLDMGNIDIYNFSQLDSFIHVSGTYYNRAPYSFLAWQSAIVNSRPNYPVPGILNIYPNPTPGPVTIQLEDDPEGLVIRVQDALGRVVAEAIPEESMFRLDLSGYAEGFYVISVHGTHGVSQSLLIKRE